MDRARGALLGLAVGDALGTTLEFETLEAPAHPTLATGPHREIVGGGPFGVVAGQVTDDTQMACSIAASLREKGGFDLDDIAARHVAWLEPAFDVGSQTAAALRAIAAGAAPLAAGEKIWEERGRNAAGNGSLMRTAPIAVYFARDLPALRRAASDESAITHFDPRCREACVAFDVAIAAAIRDGADAEEMWRAAKAEITREDLASDLDAARRDDPELYDEQALHIHRHQGYVRIAFRLAFWELLHAPSVETALIDVVNRGGDADTNGAITGALLGACYGAEAIPARWTQTVLDASPPGPFADRYHPRTLLGLSSRE